MASQEKTEALEKAQLQILKTLTQLAQNGGNRNAVNQFASAYALLEGTLKAEALAVE